MDKPVAAAPTGAKEKVEKQARQLAYDVRYKTKQSTGSKEWWKVRSCTGSESLYVTTC